MASKADRHERRAGSGRRGPLWLDPLMVLLDNRDQLVYAWAAPGQTALDLGCGWGHYSLLLARVVGPQGQVWAVDLDEGCIRHIGTRASKLGLANLAAVPASAAALPFIQDASVDFIFANGLL